MERPHHWLWVCPKPSSRRVATVSWPDTHSLDSGLLQQAILCVRMCAQPSLAQKVKNPPAMWAICVHSQGREDPLEEEMATTPVFLPKESHGHRSLAGYSPRGCTVGHDCIDLAGTQIVSSPLLARAAWVLMSWKCLRTPPRETTYVCRGNLGAVW